MRDSEHILPSDGLGRIVWVADGAWQGVSAQVARELGAFGYRVDRAGWSSVRPILARTDAALFVLELGSQEDLRHVPELSALGEAPVLVLGPLEMEEGLAHALDEGAADCVALPTHPALLAARIRRVLRESQERRNLAAIAGTDALTGLANFRTFSARLREEFKRASRYGYSLCAVMMDVDRLKEINDGLGHAAGNQVIVAVAQRLRGSLREIDFAARYGGDEFVILMTHQSGEQAAVVVERLRRSLKTARIHDRKRGRLPLRITVSAGVAAHEPLGPKRSPDALLEDADAALYAAKRSGRDRVVLHPGDLPGPGTPAGQEDWP